MIQRICDLCGEVIDSTGTRAVLNISATTGIGRGDVDLCMACFYRIVKIIDGSEWKDVGKKGK